MRMCEVSLFRSVKKCPKCTAPRAADGLEDVKYQKLWSTEDGLSPSPCFPGFPGKEIECLEVRCSTCLFSWHEFCADHEELCADHKEEELCADHKEEELCTAIRVLHQRGDEK